MGLGLFVATDHSTIGLIILSVFFAGGLFAYVREAMRLHRLISSGTVMRATILEKEKKPAGESIIHYLVTYEYLDESGRRVADEQDLNNREFFDALTIGQTIEILRSRKGSYPLGQVRADRAIAGWISLSLLLVWGIMGVVIARH